MKKGFTLIELMIVIAIIAIIAAIAIPNLLESKKSANEGNGGTSCKAVATAMVTYQSNNYSGNANNSGDYAAYTTSRSKLFADTWQRLGGQNANCHQDGAGTSLSIISDPLADASAAASAYQGYFFKNILNGVGGAAGEKNLKFDFGFISTPGVYSTTGINTFLIDAKGVVYMQDTGNNTFGDGDATAWPTADIVGGTWSTW